MFTGSVNVNSNVLTSCESISNLVNYKGTQYVDKKGMEDVIYSTRYNLIKRIYLFISDLLSNGDNSNKVHNTAKETLEDLE